MNLHNYNVMIEDIFPGKKKYEGEIGIEIEVEGRKLPKEIPSYWAVHEDGSLRGESAEYVLSKPVKRDYAQRFLQYLKKKLDEHGAECIMSNRTSVHVHLNCQGISMRQTYSIMCLYLLFEDLLTEFAGPTRIGNLFCLRASDAEYLLNKMIQAIQSDQFTVFTEENRLRYASLNVCALHKFNSLEFRALRGTVDPDTIYQWITLLLAVKDAALKYPDPRNILQEFSAKGPHGFLRHVFPAPLYSQFNLVGLEERLWESARLIQDVAYAVDWEVPPFTVKSRTFTAHEMVEEGPARPRQPRALAGNPFLRPRPIDPLPVENIPENPANAVPDQEFAMGWQWQPDPVDNARAALERALRNHGARNMRRMEPE